MRHSARPGKTSHRVHECRYGRMIRGISLRGDDGYDADQAHHAEDDAEDDAESCTPETGLCVVLSNLPQRHHTGERAREGEQQSEESPYDVHDRRVGVAWEP